MKKLHNKIDKLILKERMLNTEEARTTLSFYQYAHIPNPEIFRDHFYQLLEPIGVMGRIYVAKEGINGQMSLPTSNMESFKSIMEGIDFLQGVRLNIAIEDDGKSFFKLMIKVREKIVADGLSDTSFDVTDKGIHLSAKAFNALTDEGDTIVIDMRNHYESEVGHFEDAITPDVATFRESLPIVVKLLEKKKDKAIVMYCTGGIRCEKASAYLKHNGFENVYQLEGGIIEYARQVEAQQLPNKFIGKNFVFDERMGERITPDIIAKCHQCGQACDEHVNCANDACHILFIQCKACAESHKGCCSSKCHDFNELPIEERKEKRKHEVFNGTKFGKGRYKAHRKDHKLEP